MDNIFFLNQRAIYIIKYTVEVKGGLHYMKKISLILHNLSCWLLFRINYYNNQSPTPINEPFGMPTTLRYFSSVELPPPRVAEESI